MGDFEIGNELAILSASRNTSARVEQTYAAVTVAVGSNGLPASAGAGTNMLNVVKCLISVKIREQVDKRSYRYTIPIHDATTTYNSIIAGTTVGYSAGGDVRADQAIRGLSTAINADVTANLVVISIPVNAAGADVSSIPFDGSTTETILATSATDVLVRGLAEADYTIDQSTVGGTGTSATVADAVSASIRLFNTEKLSSGTAEWAKINGGDVVLDLYGFQERLTVNGYARIYIQVHTITAAGDGATLTYAPSVFITPLVKEGA